MLPFKFPTGLKAISCISSRSRRPRERLIMLPLIFSYCLFHLVFSEYLGKTSSRYTKEANMITLDKVENVIAGAKIFEKTKVMLEGDVKSFIIL